MNYVWAALLVCLPLCWLAGFAVGRRPRTGLDRRRGGYIRPPASPAPSLETLLTTDEIRLLEDSFSSSTPPGPVSAAWVIPRAHRDPSRLTGRGWSTVGTEALGASGARRDSAASVEMLPDNLEWAKRMFAQSLPAAPPGVDCGDAA